MDIMNKNIKTKTTCSCVYLSKFHNLNTEYVEGRKEEGKT